MFKFISSRIWLFTVLFCLLVSVYGYTADYLVHNDDWYDRLYNFHFVSIRVGHIGVVTLGVAIGVSIGLLLETFKVKNIVATAFKTIVAIAILGISLWYIFDAGKRIIQTLPDIQQELGIVYSSDVLNTIYWMAIFETFASIVMIICAYKIINSIINCKRPNHLTPMMNKRSLKISRNLSIIVGILTITAALFAFVVFVSTGNYNILVSPYKSFGPLVVAILFVICTISYLGIYKFYNKPYGDWWTFKVQNHSTVVLIMFSLSGMIGYALHEMLILFNDNISKSGLINATSDMVLKAGCYSIYVTFILICIALLIHIVTLIIYSIEFSK